MKNIYIKSLFFLYCLFLSTKINAQCNIICNGGADSVAYPYAINFLDTSLVPCWKTTATDGKIEVWQTGTAWGYNSFSGPQFFEINANMPATMYQSINASPGTTLTIAFAHMGRDATDTLIVEAGKPGGPYTFLGKFGDPQTAWGLYSVNYIVPNQGNTYHIRFRSYYWGTGNPSYGNFIDAVSICTDGSNAVGLNELKFSKLISLSPNPSTGKFTFEGLSDNFSIEVTDLAGRVVYSGQLNESKNSINLQGMHSGLYLYKLRNKQNQVQQGKLVLE